MKVSSTINSDTDSLMYEIKTEKNSNFNEKLYEKREISDNCDFSNSPSDHFLYNAENKLTILKFKNEFPGNIITEFVALKPKSYSILSQSKYNSLKNYRKNILQNFEKKFCQKISLKKIMKKIEKKNFGKIIFKNILKKKN